jgi:hypothetical protein
VLRWMSLTCQGYHGWGVAVDEAAFHRHKATRFVATLSSQLIGGLYTSVYTAAPETYTTGPAQ